MDNQPLKFTHDRQIDLPEDMLRLANRLIAIHGPGRVASERSGIHLYLPSPEGLERDGEQEIWKTHMTVNLTKAMSGTRFCAQCHKSGKSYSVEQLLTMPRLEARGFNVARRMSLQNDNSEDRYQDANGAMVPKYPLEVVPIDQLPPEHPCMTFLKYRRLDDPVSIQNLRQCLAAAYCTSYYGKAYRTCGKGFPGTMQSRLILHGNQYGSIVGYQGRILEIKGEDDQTYLLHPHGTHWVLHKDKQGNEVSGLEIQKYINAYGNIRQQTLFGYDAAVNHKGPFRFCVVVEGPLDIARIGPPAIAVIGKYVSEQQLRLLIANFDMIIAATDDDVSGNDLADSLTERCQVYGKKVYRLKPCLPGVANKKVDVADMDYATVWAMINQITTQHYGSV